MCALELLEVLEDGPHGWDHPSGRTGTDGSAPHTDLAASGVQR